MRSLLASLLTSTFVLACGGAAPTAPAVATPATDPSATSPEETCLATAAAKRARRPDEPSAVTVRHVLVKYAGAKKAGAAVTRSRGEACLRAEEARAALERGTSFEDVVKTYSEEPGALSRGGSIGKVTRTDVVAPFADAAFELGPGDVSYVVETAFGFHVVQRTE